MTEDDNKLWARVCATVRRLGDKCSRSPAPMVVAPAPNFESSLLDLHELTVQEAHDATLRFLNATSYKAVTIITGKSGVICKEFPHWMNLWGYRYIALKGGGAYRVNTKRI